MGSVSRTISSPLECQRTLGEEASFDFVPHLTWVALHVGTCSSVRPHGRSLFPGACLAYGGPLLTGAASSFEDHWPQD